jgi:hypothetical protein
MPNRPQKITFAEMRESGIRCLLVYCADRCSHSMAISGAGWPDDVRLSDIEDRFTCTACGKPGADVGPDFNWDRAQAPKASRGGDAPSIGFNTALRDDTVWVERGRKVTAK